MPEYEGIQFLKKSPFFKMNELDKSHLQTTVGKIIKGESLTSEETEIYKILMPFLKGIKKEKEKSQLLKKKNSKLEKELATAKLKKPSEYGQLTNPGDVLEIQHLLENAPFGDNPYVKDISEENRRLNEDVNLLKLKYKGQEELNHYLTMENDNLHLKLQHTRSSFDSANREFKKMSSLYNESISLLKITPKDQTVSKPFRHFSVQTDHSIESETRQHLGIIGNKEEQIVQQLIQSEMKIKDLKAACTKLNSELVANSDSYLEVKKENKILRDELQDTLVLITKLSTNK